jgi:hypothetical protein
VPLSEAEDRRHDPRRIATQLAHVGERDVTVEAGAQGRAERPDALPRDDHESRLGSAPVRVQERVHATEELPDIAVEQSAVHGRVRRSALSGCNVESGRHAGGAER